MKGTQATQTKEYVNITSGHIWYRTESNVISECDGLPCEDIFKGWTNVRGSVGDYEWELDQ